MTLNLRGHLMDLSTPKVMGIVNLTPDSFYADSRTKGEASIRVRIEEILSQGGAIVDIGAYSSRPNASEVSVTEEIKRLRPALNILCNEYPETPVSVDTFRADVARMAVEEYGASIINDISGGGIDPDMFETVAHLDVPYILMHMRGTPQTMQQQCLYEDGLISEVVDYFVTKVALLRESGLKDIILDPGYGFAKNRDQNYQLLAKQQQALGLLELPILVGVSRKSMIYTLLHKTADESLNGTSILNTYALLHGANILRVHDVWAAREAVRLVAELSKYEQPLPSTTHD